MCSSGGKGKVDIKWKCLQGLDKNKETEHQVPQGFYSSVGRGKNGF